MWGAIIGDLVGSTYEYAEFIRFKNKIKQPNIILPDNLISTDSFFSDDTILTIAILDAILQDSSYETFLKQYGNLYKNYKPDFSPYFNSAFSPGYMKWIANSNLGNSTGNGAMMRISPIGYLFNTKEKVLEETIKATTPSHDSHEAISCAKIISLIIYYARLGYDKKDIYNKISSEIDIKLITFENFNTTCYETISNCLYVLFNANNFEEAIRNIILLGGDTDTNAAIVGSMAEVLFGIDDELIVLASKKLPNEFNLTLKRGYQKVKNLS